MQCRVRIINKVLADMNVQELLNERKQLKEKILALRRQNLKAGPRRPVREPQLDEVDAGRVGNEAPKCPKDNKRCDSAASSGRGGAGGGTTMIAFRGQNLKTGPRNPFREPQLEVVELDRVGNDEPNCPKENKHCNSAASTGGGGGGVETSRIKEEEEEEEEEWDCDEEGYMWWKDKTGRWWVLAADGSWWTEDDDGEWLWEGDWWEAHWEEEGDQPEAQEERVGPTRGTGGKSGTNNQGEEKKV